MDCSYCKTETKNHKVCDFCKADLTASRPKINPFLSELETEKTQPELEKMHTYDLLLILSHIRAERSDMYRVMQSVRKAPNEAKKDNYDELNEYGQELYRNLTARKNVIEQILIDRMGYYPKRVDKKLLQAFLTRMERNKA